MAEPDLLVALYEEHGRALTRFVRRYVDDQGKVEDVVQETLLRVWRTIDRVDPDANPRGYLFTVARNVLTDEWRRQAVRPAVVADPGAEGTYHPPVPDDVDAALDGLLVNDALGRLSPDHRQAVQLVYLQQLSVASAAELLAVPPGTVKSRCYYAVRHLRTIFEEMGVLA
jgi:RNA polymerase sigma-70 factor (ECF subfamily)